MEAVDPLEPRLGKTLKRAEQTLLRAKSAVLKDLGLTLTQYVAFTELQRRPGLTGAQLARACLVSPQAMMVVLKSSEEQGLLARAPHPRHPHVLELHLTNPGREALHAARRQVEPIEERVTAAFTASERQLLDALLTRLIAAVEAD